MKYLIAVSLCFFSSFVSAEKVDRKPTTVNTFKEAVISFKGVCNIYDGQGGSVTSSMRSAYTAGYKLVSVVASGTSPNGSDACTFFLSL